jgi:hypothetical protein
MLELANILVFERSMDLNLAHKFLLGTALGK